MRILVLLMLTAVVFAGCADPTPVEGTQTVEPPIPQATADTGVIRGVVVDETITPIVGAAVTVQGTELSTETDENGFFGFGDLTPGTYFVTAKALGYNSIQSQATVEAGDDNPPVVRIQLSADPEGLPYYDEQVWDGYLYCGTPNVAICGAVKQFTGQLSDDEFDHMFDFAPNMTEIHSELVWESTQQLGANFNMIHRAAQPDVYANGQYQTSLGRNSGGSPLKGIVQGDAKPEINLGGDQEYLVAIFSGPVDGDPVGSAGFTLQQQFTLYAHSFYGYTPPEGWRFTDNSEVPDPQ